MEEIILLDAVERYLTGAMLPEEKARFEQLRQNSPEIDQMVVEHVLFLQQMEKYSEHKNLTHQLNETHDKLINSGSINEKAEVTTKGKVIQLWNKYRRTASIAASIAGITALVISGLIASLTPRVSKNQIQQLSRDIEQIKKTQQYQVNKLNDKLNEVASKIPEGAVLKGGGSAFLIDATGYLITNAHVLKGSAAIVVNNKGHEFNASIVNINTEKDLAILKVEDPDFKTYSFLPYSIRKSNTDLGEEIYTLGYPRDEIVYNMGYLSAKTGYNGDTSSLQISLSANPGNSGGPVFDKNGEVVGVLSTRETHAEGVVFAIKAKGIYQMIEEVNTDDTAFQHIKLPTSTLLKGVDRVQQIKQVEECVFQVKVYNKS
jgi:S1-C subfamily serine protease